MHKPNSSWEFELLQCKGEECLLKMSLQYYYLLALKLSIFFYIKKRFKLKNKASERVLAACQSGSAAQTGS